MLTSRNVLVVAPHPDDETLGAGGTLLRLKATGARLHWLLVTSAEGAGYDKPTIDRQAQQVERVRAAYPFDGFAWLKLPASSLYRAGRGELVDAMRKHIGEIRPETLIVPHLHDAHDDHGICHAAAVAACKSFCMAELGVRHVLAMEIPSETEAAPPTPERAFLPTVIVDISDYLERKIEIFRLYESEVQPAPKPRALEAIAAKARADGAAHALVAAERFMLLRALYT